MLSSETLCTYLLLTVKQVYKCLRHTSLGGNKENEPIWIIGTGNEKGPMRLQGYSTLIQKVVAATDKNKPKTPKYNLKLLFMRGEEIGHCFSSVRLPRGSDMLSSQELPDITRLQCHERPALV